MSVNRYSFVTCKEGDGSVIIYDSETGRGIKCTKSYGIPGIGLVAFLKPGEFRQPKIEHPLSQELSLLLISSSDFLARVADWEKRKSRLTNEFNSYPEYLPGEEKPRGYARNIPLEARARMSEEERKLEDEINSLK